jgi:hypothetical protein
MWAKNADVLVTWYDSRLSQPFSFQSISQFTIHAPYAINVLVRGGTRLILGLIRDGLSTAHSMFGRMDRIWMRPTLRYNHRHSLIKTRKNTNIAGQIYKTFG